MEERILHYRILRRLGAGGMGDVYLAEDERLGRRVALKFLPASDVADPGLRQRLRHEARALASLSHPNIAAVYALEEHEERIFLVMEYVEGDTLADRIARRPLPVPEVVTRGLALAEALAHAHSRGVIHRDVKPSNVLTPDERTTKLADFGLALHGEATRLTAEGISAGTIEYMSPEQSRGGAVDSRTDLFSLGIVLYQALTEVRPFARPTIEGTIHAIRADEPEPPTALRSGIPLELERIVMKCLRKNPEERYAGAADLAVDLREVKSQVARDENAPTATAVSTTTPRRRAVPKLAIVGGVLVAIAAVALLLLGPRLALRSGGEAEAAPRSIAVLSFQHLEDPADSRHEAIMAASLLTVGLGQSQVIPVLSLQRVQDVLRQMRKPDAPILGRDALEVGRRTGATYIVTGYIYQTHPEVVLGAEVTTTANGSVLTSTRVKAPGGEQGLFAAVDSLTMALRDGLARAGFGVRENAIDVAGLTTRNPAAYRNYVKGLDLLYQGNWRLAEEPLKAAVGADSTFALAWYYLAVATWWANEPTDAQAEVQAALRLNQRLSGREREGLQALSDLIVRDWDSAAAKYRRVLSRYPDDKEFLYGLGEALYHGGKDPEKAREALERAVQVDPTFALPYTHLVDIEIDREDRSAALAYADRLRDADPTSPASLFLRMHTNGRLGYPREALAVGREIVARFPVSFEATSRQAMLYSMLGEFDSARVILRSFEQSPIPIVRIMAAPGPAYLSLVQGRPREADRRALEATRRLGPNVPMEVSLGLANLRTESLLELGRGDEAVAVTRNAVAKLRSRAISRASYYSMIILPLVKAGRITEAERELQELERRLEPSASRDQKRDRDYSAGIIALARGRSAEAVRLLKQGRPLFPMGVGEVIGRQDYARALLAAGATDQAIIELEKAVARAAYTREPVGPFRWMILLARLYEQRGRKADALTVYRQVAHQYRFAEPGFWANEQAKAGIQRLERARAQAAAD